MILFHSHSLICLLFSISGLERKAFDNKSVTFEEHTRREHNMWHYLYFIVLIKVKDPTEFTGPESYVHEMVKVISLMTIYTITWEKYKLEQRISGFFFYLAGKMWWLGWQ